MAIQEELVLRIPADGSDATNQMSNSSENQGKNSTSSKSKMENLTHSRESSGASVKFVNVNSSTHHVDAGHKRTLSKGSDQSYESHVIILQSPTGEDITLSERLSNEDPDDITVEEDLNVEMSTELLKDSSDRSNNHSSSMNSKSPNSDYGSFCNTPNLIKASDNNNTETSKAPPESKTVSDSKNENSNSTENRQDTSIMATDSSPRQPLLSPGPDNYSSDDEVGANSSGYVRKISRNPKNTNQTTRIDMPDESDMPNRDNIESEIPAEPLKTLISFIFIFLAWVATTTSLALTHERVPYQDKPLPDLFLDNVHYQNWGLDASEIIIMCCVFSTFTLMLFHQHRSVVFRRVFFLAGLHYFYRAITMYITVLPKPNSSYVCAPTLENVSFVEILKRVAKLLAGMGLSINGNHVYCGDYIYSGHTMTLLMTYLIIREYSPKKWFLLHWFSFCVTVLGIITLLCSRGHYSIDVLIAYWITTRLWWIYHTLANNPQLTARENKHNQMAKFWWWFIFRYFEVNVGRPLPKGFNFPLPVTIVEKIPYIRNWDNRVNNG